MHTTLNNDGNEIPKYRYTQGALFAYDYERNSYALVWRADTLEDAITEYETNLARFHSNKG